MAMSVSPPKRKCPLPDLSWGDAECVWNDMCERDDKSYNDKNPKMLDRHPHLSIRTRVILLDWLNLVCDVYMLQRETFHLAVDYIDRYLTNVEDVRRQRLQLVGITCLFVAAKVEETYPPKIGEFVYVCDGACTVEEMLAEERKILESLSWSLIPITINGWLNIYMQLANETKKKNAATSGFESYTFAFPQYSSFEFTICAQLIDLALLHVDINRFRYSELAAAAMAHSYDEELAVRVSGYSRESLESCYSWLNPFAAAIREEGVVERVRHADGIFVQSYSGLGLICPGINVDECHTVQSYDISLDMFDKVVPD